MAINASAAGNIGNAVPYSPTLPVVGDPNHAKAGALLVADAPNDTYVHVRLEDSYMFIVGDDLIIKDANTATTTSENLGAIVSIDRTTYAHIAVITATGTITSSTFTVAQGAVVHAECGADNTNGWSDAIGILEKSVDTGKGESAKGAQGTMVVGNAMLYKGALINWDAAALADIGATDRNNIIHV
jgi:hypothetical protein